MHTLRDPIETVLSEYLYSRDVAVASIELLSGYKLDSQLQLLPGFSMWHGNKTIQEMLRALPSKIGVLLTASAILVRDGSAIRIKDQAASSAVLAALPSSQLLELELLSGIVSDFNETLSRMFAFLLDDGRPTDGDRQAVVDECMDVAVRLDILGKENQALHTTHRPELLAEREKLYHFLARSLKSAEWQTLREALALSGNLTRIRPVDRWAAAAGFHRPCFAAVLRDGVAMNTCSGPSYVISEPGSGSSY